MGTKVEKSNNMTSLKTDLTAALIIGVVAGLLSPVVAKVNNIKVPGIYLFVGFVVLCVVGILVGRLFAKHIPLLYKLAKFGETGGLNWLLDLGIVNLLILVTGISTGIYFAIFKAVSFAIAATNSYFWNKLWVFSGAKKQDEKTEVSKFFSVTVVGLGINVAIAFVINQVGPSIVPSIPTVSWASLAVVFGSLIAMLFNFILYKVWVFKDK